MSYDSFQQTGSIEQGPHRYVVDLVKMVMRLFYKKEQIVIIDKMLEGRKFEKNLKFL